MELPQGKKVLIFVFNLTNTTQTGIEVSSKFSNSPPPPRTPKLHNLFHSGGISELENDWFGALGVLEEQNPAIQIYFYLVLTDFFTCEQ